MRDIHLNDKCMNVVKELTIFPFGHTILLGYTCASDLMDNIMINTQKMIESWKSLRAFLVRRILSIVKYWVTTSVMDMIMVRTWEQSCKR